MLRLIVNTLGLFLLALALITAVLDLTRSVANSQIVFTALGLEWRNFHVESLQYVQVGLERHLGLSWLWTNVVLRLLLFPSWAVFTALAMLMFWFGYKPDRNWQKRFGR